MADPISGYWKFREVDKNTFRMLTTSKLWFADPKTFNDPFDSNLDATLFLKSMRSELRNYDKIMAELPTYIAHTEERLAGRYVYCTNEQSSVAPPYEEVLMWSHYANKHRGVCLGFSMKKLDDLLERTPYAGFWHYNTKKLYYGADIIREFAKYLDRTMTTEDNLVLLDKLSMVKAPNWEYENEFRFVYHDPERKNERGVLVDFHGSDLENVTFGLECPEEDEEAIRNIIGGNDWSHVTYWRVHRGTGLFELVFEDVT